MDKQSLRNQLAQVQKLATTSKLGRLMNRPVQYVYALALRDLFKSKSQAVTCDTFFGSKMHIVLPSASDIYITKGKSHDSEIRLARFLIERLAEGNSFLDVGAHYGYFSLLASEIVGEQGSVHCFEAAPSTYKTLSKNIKPTENITAINQAASDAQGQLTFYEFPPMYSEYNSMDIEQYEGQDWFVSNPPVSVNIPASPLDEYLQSTKFKPSIIKIDVEGAELKVLKGTAQFLSKNNPLVAMEFIHTTQKDSPHEQASQFLQGINYSPYIIEADGGLQRLDNIHEYMRRHQLDSENIVFVKEVY